MTLQKVLLFDVDGVLIESHGYKRSLRATLDVFAAQLGQPPFAITEDEIAAFDSVALTNEWDSSAMVGSVLLLDLLDMRPNLVRSSIAETAAAIREAGVTVPRRDLIALAHACMDDHPHGKQLPSATIFATLNHRASEDTRPLLREMLSNIYDYRSPMTYIFQQHTLGGSRFAETYGHPPEFHVESHLETYDRILLSEQSRSHLQDVISRPGWKLSIFTARASLPPSDYANGHDGAPELYPPEADIAISMLDFDGHVPVIASGKLAWLATRRGRAIASYVKPSPVHALSAVGAALCGCESKALEAAAEFVENGSLDGPLAKLTQTSTQVIVFEDTAGGIRATRAAVDLLRQAGVSIQVEAVGIANQTVKQNALAGLADHIFDDINQALATLLP